MLINRYLPVAIRVNVLFGAVDYTIVLKVPCPAVIFPVDSSVNWTESSAFPESGVPMNPACGGRPALLITRTAVRAYMLSPPVPES